MLILTIISLSFISSYESKSDIFEVRNLKKSLAILRQLNNSQEIQDRLSTWEKELKENPLIFEDPVNNFLFILILLKIDMKEDMDPGMLNTSLQRTLTMPNRGKLKKAAVLMNDMMSLYNIPIQQENVILTSQLFHVRGKVK